MSDITVSPPATEEWWDAEATKTAVLNRLRLADSSDIDDARIEDLIPVAGFLINSYLDRISDPAPDDYVPPASVQGALESITVDLYRDPSVVGAGGTVIIDDVNPIRQTLKLLAGPAKERWGIA